jgi:hypothetical protein
MTPAERRLRRLEAEATALRGSADLPPAERARLARSWHRRYSALARTLLAAPGPGALAVLTALASWGPPAPKEGTTTMPKMTDETEPIPVRLKDMVLARSVGSCESCLRSPRPGTGRLQLYRELGGPASYWKLHAVCSDCMEKLRAADAGVRVR